MSVSSEEGEGVGGPPKSAPPAPPPPPPPTGGPNYTPLMPLLGNLAMLASDSPVFRDKMSQLEDKVEHVRAVFFFFFFFL
jgi:hypothetical protein